MTEILIILGIVLLGGLLGYGVLQTLLASLVGAVVGGAIGAIFILRRDRDHAPASSAAAEPAADDAGADVAGMVARLIRLNISTRVGAFPEEVSGAIERVIDTLRELLPEVNERYPGHALTWGVNQTARDYLPRLVNRYAALDPDQRQEQTAEILESLRGLEEGLDRAETAVRSHQDDDFAVVAKFLDARFNDSFA